MTKQEILNQINKVLSSRPNNSKIEWTLLKPFLENIEWTEMNVLLKNIVNYLGESSGSDLSLYAKKADIPVFPDMALYAKKTDIPVNADLSLYAKKADIPVFPDMALYAKKTDIPANADLSLYAKKADIPVFPDMALYAKKSDIPANADLSLYAKKADIITTAEIIALIKANTGTNTGTGTGLDAGYTAGTLNNGVILYPQLRDAAGFETTSYKNQNSWMGDNNFIYCFNHQGTIIVKNLEAKIMATIPVGHEATLGKLIVNNGHQRTGFAIGITGWTNMTPASVLTYYSHV